MGAGLKPGNGAERNTVMGLKVSPTLPPWCEHLRTGAGESGLVFLEVEKSRPINPAKKSRGKNGSSGQGLGSKKAG